MTLKSTVARWFCLKGLSLYHKDLFVYEYKDFHLAIGGGLCWVKWLKKG